MHPHTPTGCGVDTQNAQGSPLEADVALYTLNQKWSGACVAHLSDEVVIITEQPFVLVWSECET